MSDHELREFAKASGFLFIRNTCNHYVLRDPRHAWQIDVRPASSRPLTFSNTWPRPRFAWDPGWTLEDAVRAVAEKLQTVESHQ